MTSDTLIKVKFNVPKDQSKDLRLVPDLMKISAVHNGRLLALEMDPTCNLDEKEY